MFAAIRDADKPLLCRFRLRLALAPQKILIDCCFLLPLPVDNIARNAQIELTRYLVSWKVGTARRSGSHCGPACLGMRQAAPAVFTIGVGSPMRTNIDHSQESSPPRWVENVLESALGGLATNPVERYGQAGVLLRRQIFLQMDGKSSRKTKEGGLVRLLLGKKCVL